LIRLLLLLLLDFYFFFLSRLHFLLIATLLFIFFQIFILRSLTSCRLIHSNGEKLAIIRSK